ncbi:MAG TPA: acyloxyacyl hydrolase [Pyrinomonadaceae bacterium]
MLKVFVVVVVVILSLCTDTRSIDAQASIRDTVNANAVADLESPQDAGGNPVYTLQKRDNEFAFWGGISFSATTVFGGLHKDEAANRKFIIAAFRYGRTLAANNSVALQYTVDAIPLAVATGDIVSSTTVGGVTVFNRETAYGGGLTPLGLQVDFANGSRIHPFVHVNGGGLIFNKPVPLPDSGKFAFVGEAGGGVRVFTSERRAVTIGLRFHHISNGNLSGANRGLNQFLIYAGFSIFK